jgi:hypothetical protein
MLIFLIGNIFVDGGSQVFIVGVPMGTNGAPLLADLFLHSCNAESIQKLVHDIKQSHVVAFHQYFVILTTFYLFITTNSIHMSIRYIQN